MANFKLGSRVVYIDGDGFEKIAEVVGTRESVQDGGKATRPEKGSAHLLIKSPTGKTYFRENVPFGEGPRTFARRG